jgi:transposase
MYRRHRLCRVVLGNAFDRFFKKLGEYPQFKKKGKNDSFTIDAEGKPIPVGGTRIKLPTIGWVRTFERLPNTTCKSMTISRIVNDWFIAFAYEQKYKPTEKQYEIVGVDLGVKELATLSTGIVFSNPKYYKKNLAQSISDCGFYEFKRQLEYKCLKLGSELIIADRFFPSSKTCSNCSCKKDILTLSDRIFNCDNCGFKLDRDLNAAINLSRLAKA